MATDTAALLVVLGLVSVVVLSVLMLVFALNMRGQWQEPKRPAHDDDAPRRRSLRP